MHGSRARKPSLLPQWVTSHELFQASTTESQVVASMLAKPATKRSAADVLALRQWARRVELLRHLHLMHRTRLVSELQLRSLSAGSQLFREGDPAHAAFIIVSGTISLCCGGREVGVVEANGCVGAADLLNKPGSRRANSAAASTDAQLAVLSRDAFFRGIRRVHTECLQSRARFLRLFRGLAPCTSSHLTSMAKKLSPVVLREGEVVVQQDDPVTRIVFVVMGNIRFTRVASAVPAAGGLDSDKADPPPERERESEVADAPAATSPGRRARTRSGSRCAADARSWTRSGGRACTASRRPSKPSVLQTVDGPEVVGLVQLALGWNTYRATVQAVGRVCAFVARVVDVKEALQVALSRQCPGVRLTATGGLAPKRLDSDEEIEVPPALSNHTRVTQVMELLANEASAARVLRGVQSYRRVKRDALRRLKRAPTRPDATVHSSPLGGALGLTPRSVAGSWEEEELSDEDGPRRPLLLPQRGPPSPSVGSRRQATLADVIGRYREGLTPRTIKIGHAALLGSPTAVRERARAALGSQGSSAALLEDVGAEGMGMYGEGSQTSLTCGRPQCSGLGPGSPTQQPAGRGRSLLAPSTPSYSGSLLPRLQGRCMHTPALPSSSAAAAPREATPPSSPGSEIRGDRSRIVGAQCNRSASLASVVSVLSADDDEAKAEAERELPTWLQAREQWRRLQDRAVALCGDEFGEEGEEVASAFNNVGFAPTAVVELLQMRP